MEVPTWLIAWLLATIIQWGLNKHRSRPGEGIWENLKRSTEESTEQRKKFRTDTRSPQSIDDRSKHLKSNSLVDGIGLGLVFGSVAVGLLILVGDALIKGSKQMARQNVASTEYKHSQNQTSQSSKTSNTSLPPAIAPQADPALEIKSKYYFYPDPNFPSLNASDEYAKTVGDLARIQERMLQSRGASRNYPKILIGAGKFTGNCDINENSLGVYNHAPGCQTIMINFQSQGVTYERSIEVATVLAHEYGHHLTEITAGINNISRLESELIADCFAGLVHGYWGKHGKITNDDIKTAIEMMIYVSKQEAMNSSDSHGDPGQRSGAFAAGFMKASGKETTEYQNYCKGLEKVIDFSKGLP